MLQVNVVLCPGIPLVVVKDDPIHFSKNVNEMCLPVGRQNSLVFGLHSLAEFAVECLTVPSFAFV